MNTVTEQISPGRAIRQRRGQVTYQALLQAGLALLEKEDLETITVADITRKAGYSVGAFYTRFHSKDEFFEALVLHHLETRTQELMTLFETLPIERLARDYVVNLVNYYWPRRRFWRAVLHRCMRDPDFWEPIRQRWHVHSGYFIKRLVEEIGRPLSDQEERRIYFAFQVSLGTVNSMLIYRTGPVAIGQQSFVEELSRVFEGTSDIHALLREAGLTNAARTVGKASSLP